ncbi:MAG: sugar transferase [Mucilaginibacter sp.]
MPTLYLNRIKKYLFLADVVFLNLAVVIAHYFIFGIDQPNFSSKAFFILANGCWCFISFFNKNYNISQPPNINTIIDKFLMTLIYQLLLVLATIYFFKIPNISRGFVIISFSIFSLFVVIQRTWLFYFLRYQASRYLNKKVIVIGNKGIAKSLISTFTGNPAFGYMDYEYLERDQNEHMDENFYLDGLLVKEPDEIFVCYKEMSIQSLDQLIIFGNQNAIKIKVVYDVISRRKRNGDVNDLPILHLDAPPEVSKKIRFLKRSFDISFASTIMIIGAPVFGLIWLITKLTSKGKAFYKQERIGKNEKPFYIYKFRSMYTDSEKFGPQLSKDHDPRVTKWGRIMRKTRLDELPQFWNVLRGEMSIVGYRPERKHFIEEIAKKIPEYKRLLLHKPGITSLGQVHYGYAENVDQMCERLRFDLLYFCNVNLNSDVNIILKTVKVMVQGKGK